MPSRPQGLERDSGLQGKASPTEFLVTCVPPHGHLALEAGQVPNEMCVKCKTQVTQKKSKSQIFFLDIKLYVRGHHCDIAAETSACSASTP